MAELLIVDDNPANLQLLVGLLLPQHHVRAATSGERALQLCDQGPLPDLIILDLMLSGMSGFEVLQRLKSGAATAGIPVIIVSGLNDGEAEERGLALGAADFLAKPVRPNTTLARVQLQLELRAARVALQDRAAWLEDEVRRRVAENSLTQDASILALAHLAETRDPETGKHLLRTQGYVRALCDALSCHPRFEAYLTRERRDLMVKSAPLHDIGKVGIPDGILLKRGPLTASEWQLMKTHSLMGWTAIDRAETDIAQPLPFLEIAKQIARHHHERWDGSGYPDRLSGTEIPVPARLMALADVFDALVSIRPYKKPFPIEQATAIIDEGRGTHFDPDVVDAFHCCRDVIVAIAREHADTDAEVRAHLERLRAHEAPPN